MRTKFATIAGSLIASAAIFLALTPVAHATPAVESVTLGTATTTCSSDGLTSGTGTICAGNTAAFSLTALENGTQTLNAVVGSQTSPVYLVVNDTTTTTATLTFSGTAATGVPLACDVSGTYASSQCAISGVQGAAITGANYGPPSGGWPSPMVAQFSFTAIPVNSKFDVTFSVPSTSDIATLTGPCYGACQVAPTCSAGQTTTITGTVYVPNGADPLPNALVYIPSAIPDPLTPGVQCLVSGTEATGSPVAETHTAVDGTFTLTGVPTGINIPIVIESGKWRMQGTVQTVTGCTSNVAPKWATTFPSTHMQGDIPKMALVTGNVDSLECVLRKTGLNNAEFDNPGGTGQVDFYKGSGNGGAVINSSTPSENTLVGSASTLANYDMVMFPCQGAQYDQSTADLANIYNYANIGGRVFTTHYSYVWLYNNPTSTTGFGTAATWDINRSDPAPDPGIATVNTNFTGGSTLSQWLQNAGASTTLSQIEISTLRLDQTGVVAPTQSWLTLNTNTTTSDNDPHPVMQMTFNTPVGAAASAQCGRVLFNEYHVENNNGDNGDTFPTECSSGAMTPQEKLLEYALFDLSTAIVPVVTPTVSQSYVNYSSTTTPNTDFTQGDNGDTITADVTNTSSTVALASSIVFTATLPTGVTATSMTDPTGGWTCTVSTLTCTRTTPLAPSASDSIIITTDVASNAPTGTGGSLTSTISGGGLSSNVVGTDPLTILGAQPQAITFNPTTPVTYGVSPITLTATGGACSTPVTFSIVSGNGTLSGTNDDILTVTGTGPIVVAANQAGCSGYTAAPTVDKTINVNPAVLTVSAQPSSKIYGSANPSFTDTITGFVNGDSSSVVSGTASLTTTATTGSGVGSYPITAAQGSLSASNYTFVYAPSTLTVNPAVLTVTANDATKTYDSPNPTFTDSITGFVNGDNSSVVSGAASLTTTAVTSSPVGSYPITAAKGTLAASNYTFTYDPGTLTVTPAAGAISWPTPAPVTYGTAFTSAQIDPSATCGGVTVPGSWSWSPSNPLGQTLNAGTDSYTATFTPTDTTDCPVEHITDSLVVNPAVLTVTAQNATRGYGVANPTFTDSITGFVNGDNSSVVSGAASLTTTADLTSPAGNYPITAAQGTLAASNYTFAYVPGTLTVAQAAGAISWPTPAAITYGTPLSSTQLDAAATCGGVTVPGTYVYTPLLGTVLGAGTHTLSVTFTPTDTADCPTESTTVSLTVNPAVLTVAAQPDSKTYGAANPSFTDAITGFVNGDSSSVVTGTASLTTTATTGSPAGSYPITAAQGSLAASNYTFAYTPSTLTVNPAVLTVTAQNATRAYGVDNPTFTDSITGFVNGDNSSVVSGAASLTTTAGLTSPAGPYPITAAQGTLAATNYTFTYVNGTLTVTPQTGSISWATPAPITYGTPLSATQLNAVAMCDGSIATGTYVYTPPAPTVLDAGTHTLSVAFTPSNPGVCPAEATTVSILVNPVPQTITFTTPSTEPYGSAPLVLNGTGGASGNPVTYTVTGPATLSGNVLTFTGWGTVTVTANQAGNTDYTAATPVTQTILVTQPPVSTNVVLSLSHEVFTYPGEANVTVCVSVTSNVAATGMIQIFDNGTLLTTQPAQGGGCAYWYIQPGLDAGPHAFSAYYLGDSVNPPGYSNTVAFTVSLFPTVLEVNCWNPSFAYGADYSCDANPDSGPLQGYVEYSINGAPAVHVALGGNDHALWTIHEPAVGNYTMTIDYPQQGNYAAFALPTQTYTVTPAIDEVAFTPSSWSPSAGSSVTLSASVTSQSAGAPNAIGSVSFYDGSTLLQTVPVDSNGNATFTTTFTSGYHNLIATYSGANYSTNSTTINLQVQ